MTPRVLSMPSPQVNDRRILLRAPQAQIISRVDAVLTSGTSPSGHWLWLQVTAGSGAPHALTVAVVFS